MLAFIAKTVTHNGRDLEGALNRLLAHSKLTGQPITLEMAEREMRDLVRSPEPKRIKIEEIQRIVARQYNVAAQTSCRPAEPRMLCAHGKSQCIWRRS